MKNINYYGQKITVSDEVAEFLEQDRLRESAQRRSDQRHLDFVGNEIYTMPGLFTDEPTDPTFEQAFLLLRKHKLRKIFPTLPDDDQKLLRFYYFRFYTLEQIGKEFGISKMAISKRLRKILDLLRSLMEDEAPYFSQIFLETRFTNLLCVSYKVNHKHKKALRSHSVHALHLKNLDYEEMERKLKPLAEQLGIADILIKYPYEVSGGQKQRAAVARALITDPQIVLADEPTGALDSRSSDNLLELFGEINKGGQTILMVTHSVKAASHAGRVLFLRDGRVYHQLYRGSESREAQFRRISDTLTVLTQGGENHG